SIDGSGKFLEMHDMSPSDGGYYRSGQTIEINLPSGSSIVKANAYSLLFMANASGYIENIDSWKETLAGKTETEVKQLRVGVEGSTATASSSAYYDYDAYIQSNLMMSGTVNKEAGQDLIIIELTRLVSRFDIANKAGAAYKLVSASVWNGFPDEIIWDNKYSDFSKARIKRLYRMEVENDNVTGGLYAYENFVTKPEANDE
ncbi:MAG: hypothetical protein LUD15_00815, partial [Bacteroides sp.]|nr:hypothetical protein [Bacteroides sp.]